MGDEPPLNGQPQAGARTEILNLQGLWHLWLREEQRYIDDIEAYRDRQTRGVVLALVGFMIVVVVSMVVGS